VRRGCDVVLSGRAFSSAGAAAEQLGSPAGGIALDLSAPHAVAEQLAGVGQVDRLVLAAIARDVNTVHDYEINRAVELVTLKLVGYTEVVHALGDRMHDETSILLFGGLAKDRPYPGSTTVTA